LKRENWYEKRGEIREGAFKRKYKLDERVVGGEKEKFMK